MDSRAYTEAIYIINEMSEEMRSKIPEKIIRNIESKSDKNYNFYIKDKDFEHAELLEDTEKILSVLYTDYLATEKEKMVIKNKEKIIAERKKVKLPDVQINELFPQAKEESRELIAKEESKELIEIKPEKWHTKIKKFFIKIFNIRVFKKKTRRKND